MRCGECAGGAFEGVAEEEEEEEEGECVESEKNTPSEVLFVPCFLGIVGECLKLRQEGVFVEVDEGEGAFGDFFEEFGLEVEGEVVEQAAFFFGGEAAFEGLHLFDGVEVEAMLGLVEFVVEGVFVASELEVLEVSAVEFEGDAVELTGELKEHPLIFLLDAEFFLFFAFGDFASGAFGGFAGSA